jgi:DNA-binding transcriptional MerR regulator
MTEASTTQASTTQASTTGAEMTIDDLARQAQLPVRTIREYHTMRLLPPPERRGRVGYYGPRHAQRLQLIARLQRRGYSLAGIRDLTQAWDAGENLPWVLGVEPGHGALDETPLRLTRAELLARLPGLTGAQLHAACAAGLICPAEEDFGVRSPALLALVADGAGAGIPLSEMLYVAGTLHRELASLADMIADAIVDRLLPALQADSHPGDLAPLLQRGRLLLLQGAASTLADRLGAALLRRTDDANGSAALRAAVERVRVGAITDAAGHIHRLAR